MMEEEGGCGVIIGGLFTAPTLTREPASGVDFVQEHVLGQGPQDNESAVEQAKDEQISDFIRDQYKNTTGSEFPVKDKDRF